MTVDKLVGPATVVYLVSASIAALWWASNLTTRVAVLEHTAVTAERIARLETHVSVLSQSTSDMKLAVTELVSELHEKE